MNTSHLPIEFRPIARHIETHGLERIVSIAGGIAGAIAALVYACRAAAAGFSGRRPQVRPLVGQAKIDA